MLSEWMRKHLAGRRSSRSTCAELVEDAERAVIAHYDPPLNLRGGQNGTELVAGDDPRQSYGKTSSKRRTARPDHAASNAFRASSPVLPPLYRDDRQPRTALTRRTR